MKKLTLIRHGKSSWNYDVSDRDRPLLERGINDAYLVASAINKPVIDAVFSSPANRALHTCNIFLRVLNIPSSELRIYDELYDFSGEHVINFIKSLDNKLQNVVIFGHNHALTHIVNMYGDKVIENVPTSGLVELSFNILEWGAITKGSTQNVIFPKQLKND
ncbi:SixA phosphatase family protein [Cellulophaga omnivescoria]|uniref:SixA phosphatase family protein n=1 Tax=Cellulophaga omnivescoria TaxID=1888890 RepID=UPI000984BD58|nr:phosphoglycerate mutase family protein [Cellulophaga omnivescoria]WBU88754.1 phosphoglycerate mutase family protein [Cellulophaga omnivescoria]WKB80729.1 phosphoglycerate mutase family protein [Cellulophaga lytica]